MAHCLIKIMTKSEMHSILKDHSLDHTKSDNHCGITLSPIISKLFEMCLQKLFCDYLWTNDLQLGFKAKAGCQNALFSLLL